VDDDARRVALVGVDPPEERQQAGAAGRPDRADRPLVAGDRGRGEAGQVRGRHLGHHLAEALGGRPPAGPEDDGGVVGVDAGPLGQRRGGAPGQLEGVAHAAGT
jgi:hypothetical protein